MDKQSPKKPSLESLFSYLVSEDSFFDSDLAYGTTSESYRSSDESVAVSKQSPKDHRKSDIGDKAEEHKAPDKAKMTNMAEFKKQKNGREQADPEPAPSEAQTDESVESADSSQQCSCTCTTLGREFEDQVLSAVADLMDTHIRAVIPVLVDEAVRDATQDLHKVARDAAKEEMRKHIAAACYESTEEKVQAITTRLEELDENTLERVFAQKSMVEMLRRLVEKEETDLALMEWEKV
ncbi:hypothetical protein PG988_007465 [Apiospora saccharicola]